MNESITLGNLRFVAIAQGTHVAVRVHGSEGDVDLSGMITQTEWHSLLAISDTLRAHSELVERIARSLAWLDEQQSSEDPTRREMAQLAAHVVRRIAEGE